MYHVPMAINKQGGRDTSVPTLDKELVCDG